MKKYRVEYSLTRKIYKIIFKLQQYFEISTISNLSLEFYLKIVKIRKFEN